MNRSFPSAAYGRAAAKCRLFEGLPAQVTASFPEKYGASLREYSRGDVVFSPDSFQKGLGLIIRGSATAVKKAAGREIRMSKLTPGSLFGMACLYSDVERFATEIRANNACVLVFWKKADVDRMLADNPPTAANYIAVLTERINHLSRRLDILSCPAPADRLAAYIATLPADENGCAELTLPISALARDLNISRTTLYRLLSDMKDKGLYTDSENGRKLMVRKSPDNGIGPAFFAG